MPILNLILKLNLFCCSGSLPEQQPMLYLYKQAGVKLGYTKKQKNLTNSWLAAMFVKRYVSYSGLFTFLVRPVL
jgi:hypothetical protein